MSLYRIGIIVLVLFLKHPVFSQEIERYSYNQQKMGTQFRLVFYANDSIHAQNIADKAWKEVDFLNAIFSDYDENSELSTLSASSGSGKWIQVSEKLWKVLSYAQKLSIQTGGLFDVTIGPLSKLWRRAIRRHELPTTSDIEEAMKAVGYGHILFDSLTRSVQLTAPGMRLDLGAVAKGYTVDEISKLLLNNGLRSFLVDGGGDLYAGDPPPGKGGWMIHLDERGNQILLSNSAIASSGDKFRFLEVEGKRYAHIVNPLTGYGVSWLQSTFVQAPNCMTADALASVFCLSKEQDMDNLKAHYKFEILK